MVLPGQRSQLRGTSESWPGAWDQNHYKLWPMVLEISLMITLNSLSLNGRINFNMVKLKRLIRKFLNFVT